jgi:FkbM family methyltransferase
VDTFEYFGHKVPSNLVEQLRSSIPSQILRSYYRSQCHTAQLDEGIAVTRVLGEKNIFVQRSDHALGVHLMMNGFWEFELTRAIARACRPGSTAIDCGANYGYFTCVMAAAVGSSGLVHAIEPNEYLAGLLASTLRVNGILKKSTQHNFAAWSSSGLSLEFGVPPRQPMNGRLIAAIPPHAAKKIRSSMFVQTQTINEMCANSTDISAIKIDVEGSEMEVLEGAKEVIKASNDVTVFLEVNPKRYDASAQWESTICSLGMNVGRLIETGLIEPILDLGKINRPSMLVLTK